MNRLLAENKTGKEFYSFFKFLEEKRGERTPLKLKLMYDPSLIKKEDLNVKGDLKLSDTDVSALPKGLKVGGFLWTNEYLATHLEDYVDSIEAKKGVMSPDNTPLVDTKGRKLEQHSFILGKKRKGGRGDLLPYSQIDNLNITPKTRKNIEDVGEVLGVKWKDIITSYIYQHSWGGGKLARSIYVRGYAQDGTECIFSRQETSSPSAGQTRVDTEKASIRATDIVAYKNTSPQQIRHIRNYMNIQ